MFTIHSIDTIVSNPEFHDGDPMIAGRRIRVIDLVASHLYRGLTADELAENFSLDPGQVYAALAYYYQHKTALDNKLRANAQAAAQLRQQLAAQGKLIDLE